MPTERVQSLIAKLEKGLTKTEEILRSLAPHQWSQVLYAVPSVWNSRDILAHLVSAEERLLEMAQDVAAGGEGAPPGFRFRRLQCGGAKAAHGTISRGTPVSARQVTLDWVRTLNDSQLDRLGRHPVLGEITLEAMITAIDGHQLLHVRDLKSKFP
jgi:DinB superfamily